MRFSTFSSPGAIRERSSGHRHLLPRARKTGDTTRSLVKLAGGLRLEPPALLTGT